MDLIYDCNNYQSIIQLARRRIIGIVGPMGFVRSYLQLPRYQRVLIGCIGIAVGWYGPTAMSYLLLELPASKNTATNSKTD